MIKENAVTPDKLEAALDDVTSMEYESMHSRYARAYADYEHSIRVLLAFMKQDYAACGDSSKAA